MKFKNFDLEDFIIFPPDEIGQGKFVLDEKLGWVFYPSTSAIEEALEKSMA